MYAKVATMQIYIFFSFDHNFFPTKICDTCKNCIDCSLKISCILCESCKKCMDNQCQPDLSLKRFFKFQIFLYNFILNFQRSNNQKTMNESEFVKETLQSDKEIYKGSVANNKNACYKIKMNENVKEIIRLCLQDNFDRPNILKLLLNQKLQAAFEGLYCIDDFPNLIK